MSLWDVTARAGEIKAILEFQERGACFLLRFLSWEDVSMDLVLCGRKQGRGRQSWEVEGGRDRH